MAFFNVFNVAAVRHLAILNFKRLPADPVPRANMRHNKKFPNLVSIAQTVPEI